MCPACGRTARWRIGRHAQPQLWEVYGGEGGATARAVSPSTRLLSVASGHVDEALRCPDYGQPTGPRGLEIRGRHHTSGASQSYPRQATPKPHRRDTMVKNNRARVDKSDKNLPREKWHTARINPLTKYDVTPTLSDAGGPVWDCPAVSSR